MIAGAIQVAHPTADAGVHEQSRQFRRQQQVVDAQALVLGPAEAKVRPEGPQRPLGMDGAQGVGPALVEQPLERRAALGPQQRVPGIGVVGVEVGLKVLSPDAQISTAKMTGP